LAAIFNGIPVRFAMAIAGYGRIWGMRWEAAYPR
jgi:hypothetical protein